MDPQTVIQWTIDAGIFDAWIPFALIMIITLIGLSRTNFLDKKTKTVVAIAIGAMTVWAHISPTINQCFDPVNMINDSIPSLGLVAVGILAFIFGLGLIGIRLNMVKWLLSIMVLASLSTVVFTFLVSAGPGCLPFDIGAIPYAEYLLTGAVFLLGLLLFSFGGGGAGDGDIY